MSQPLQDEGYVINLYDLGDSSLITHVFLKGNGVVKLVAKGAKSPKSPFSGCLELFNKVEVSYQQARGTSDLHTTREISVITQSEGIRNSYPRLLTASYFCALVDYWVTLESGDLYDLFSRALEYVNDNELKWRGVTYFEEELSRLLGYSKRSEEVTKIYRANQRIEKLRKEVERTLET